MDIRRWSGPLLLIDTWSADHRRIARPRYGSVRSRPLPLALYMLPPQARPQEGFQDGGLVGTVDTMYYRSDTDDLPAHVTATGALDLDLARVVHPEHTARLEDGHPLGIGVSLDEVVHIEVSGYAVQPAGLAVQFHEPQDFRQPVAIQINGWRVNGACLHDTPAWPQTQITLDAQ